jgi:hypothetical protein
MQRSALTLLGGVGTERCSSQLRRLLGICILCGLAVAFGFRGKRFLNQALHVGLEVKRLDLPA